MSRTSGTSGTSDHGLEGREGREGRGGRGRCQGCEGREERQRHEAWTAGTGTAGTYETSGHGAVTWGGFIMFIGDQHGGLGGHGVRTWGGFRGPAWWNETFGVRLGDRGLGHGVGLGDKQGHGAATRAQVGTRGWV